MSAILGHVMLDKSPGDAMYEKFEGKVGGSVPASERGRKETYID